MTKPCKITEEQLSLYSDGLLSDNETQSIKAHVSECSECAKSLEDLVTLTQNLRQLEDSDCDGLLSNILTSTVSSAECQQVLKTLPLYDTLSETESSRVYAHTKDCCYCASQLQSYQKLGQALSGIDDQAPETLRDHIAAATCAKVPHFRFIDIIRKPAFGLAACGAMALVLVTWNGWFGGSNTLIKPIQNQGKPGQVSPLQSSVDSKNEATKTAVLSDKLTLRHTLSLNIEKNSKRSVKTRSDGSISSANGAKIARLPVPGAASIGNEPPAGDLTLPRVESHPSPDAPPQQPQLSPNDERNKRVILVRVEPGDVINRQPIGDIAEQLQRIASDRKKRILTEHALDLPQADKVAVKFWQAKF